MITKSIQCSVLFYIMFLRFQEMLTILRNMFSNYSPSYTTFYFLHLYCYIPSSYFENTSIFTPQTLPKRISYCSMQMERTNSHLFFPRYQTFSVERYFPSSKQWRNKIGFVREDNVSKILWNKFDARKKFCFQNFALFFFF